LDHPKRNSENRIVVAYVHLDPISKTPFSFVSFALFVMRSYFRIRVDGLPLRSKLYQ